MIYEIAGLIVEMNPKHEPLKSQVIPYLVEKARNIDLIIPQGTNTISNFQKEHSEIDLGLSEYLLYGAYFHDKLLDHKGIYLHASCVVYDGFAYLFSASSGVGKSTHAQIWLNKFKGSFILNDDKPILKVKNNILMAYGSPFSGKTNLNKNASYPVKGIAFIKRDEQNNVRQIKPNESVKHFLINTLKPRNENKLDLMIEIIEKIINLVDIYEFKCNTDEESAKLAYEAMK